MYGKHFASMYNGSLYGSGAIVFAVWGYVIANQVPDRKYGAQVTLNPRQIADTLGETVDAVLIAIDFLMQPDPNSTTKTHEGRRLIQLGEFDYQVVNGAKYRAIRNQEDRREQNRMAKRRQREMTQGQPLSGETAYEKAVEAGDQAQADAIEDEQFRRMSNGRHPE